MTNLLSVVAEAFSSRDAERHTDDDQRQDYSNQSTNSCERLLCTCYVRKTLSFLSCHTCRVRTSS